MRGGATRPFAPEAATGFVPVPIKSNCVTFIFPTLDFASEVSYTGERRRFAWILFEGSEMPRIVLLQQGRLPLRSASRGTTSWPPAGVRHPDQLQHGLPQACPHPVRGGKGLNRRPGERQRTFLNTTKVEGLTPLKNNDRLKLGPIMFRVEAAGDGMPG